MAATAPVISSGRASLALAFASDLLLSRPGSTEPSAVCLSLRLPYGSELARRRREATRAYVCAQGPGKGAADLGWTGGLAVHKLGNDSGSGWGLTESEDRVE